jgi:hypothetical protein
VVVLIPDFKVNKKLIGKNEPAKGSKVVVDIQERLVLIGAKCKKDHS